MDVDPTDVQPIAERLRDDPSRVVDRFSDSLHSAGAWSSYDLDRRDSRRDQVHDQNRHELWEDRNELQQQVEALQAEMALIAQQIAIRNQRIGSDLEAVLHGLDGREMEAAEALQDAILELVEDAEAGDVEDDTGEPEEAGATATVPAVLAMTRALLNQCVGALLLTEKTLVWVARGEHVSTGKPRIQLANVVDLKVAPAEGGGAQLLSVTAELSTSITYSFV